MSAILRELGRLERAGIVELDPRAMIDVVRIVEMVGEHNPEVLAHSLASRLTHDPAHHDHVLRALLPGGPHAQPTSAAPPPPSSAPLAGPLRLVDQDGPPARRTLKLPQFLRQLSGLRALALLSVTSLAIVLGGPFATRAIVKEIDPAAVPAEEPDTPSPRPAAGSSELPPPDPQSVTPSTRLDPLESGRRADLSVPEERPLAPPGPRWLALVIFLGGALVLTVTVAWWRAPGNYRRLVELARARARDQREAWTGQGHVSAVPYHIERAAPFSPSHIDDAATILGRLSRREPGLDLDVPATVTATLDAGGRITPVRAPSRRREHLLVLVDRESRQHPYLDGAEWLLARWRRLGLQILRFDYHNTPATLKPEHGPELTLDALRRQTEGLLLLILSRMHGARGYQGQVALARALDAWPVRAWLDLDPTPFAERDHVLQHVARTLESAGTPRYPFTEAGLLAAARALAEGSPRHRLVAELALPPLSALDTALMVWAGTAACVPDASWVQLDALRRRFGGFSELTPDGTPLDGRALERLLAWISAHRYHSGLLGEGARLYFTPAGRRALLRALRRHDRERWPSDPEARFEARARRSLIAQLRNAAVSDDPYRRALRDMKIAVHEAILDPAQADRLLPGFADKAVAYELIEQLEDELSLQEGGAAFDRPWSASDHEALRAYVQGDARARVPDLLGRPRPTLAALLLIAASAGSWALWATRPTTRTLEYTWAVEVPPTWELVKVPDGADDDLVALADVAPMRFVKIPSGIFNMGSSQAERNIFKKLYPDLTDSDFADERLHVVTLSSFELAATEVTNAQWKALMGSSPSDCKFGCDDNHPVQNVSWVMAVEYLNKLTDRENERRPATARRTRCYEQRGDTWEWVKGCTGYRLPTEAEWEYAARAGTRTAYSFGDDPKELCKHGNGAAVAVRREHAMWTANEACADGATNLATVRKYAANPWGLFDMHGNVWEWTWDWYDDKYGDNDNVTDDPRGRRSGNSRVLRGGSYRDAPAWLRSANRDGVRPMNAYVGRGLRCARASPPSP